MTTAKKQYRGILSFSTGAGLPDNAVITKVTLKVKKQGIIGGGNPVATFQGFMVDIKKGFFGTTALQTSDFQAAAHKTYGPFMTALGGGWYSIDLTPGKGYINKLSTLSGLTQIRLRFKLDDNNNTVANYLSLYSGNAPAASRPQLIIEYYTVGITCRNAATRGFGLPTMTEASYFCTPGRVLPGKPEKEKMIVFGRSEVV